MWWFVLSILCFIGALNVVFALTKSKWDWEDSYLGWNVFLATIALAGLGGGYCLWRSFQ